MIRTFLIRRDGYTLVGPVLPKLERYFRQAELHPMPVEYPDRDAPFATMPTHVRTFQYVGEAGPYHVYGEV